MAYTLFSETSLPLRTWHHDNVKPLEKLLTSQVALVAKNPPANAGAAGDTGSVPGGEEPWRRQWQPTPHSCLENESHGRRSLEGCSPWGCKRAEVGRGGSRAGWAPGSGSDVRPRVRVAFRAPQGARGRRERHLYSQSTACGSTSQTSTGRGGLPWWSSLPSTAGDAGPIPGQVTEIPHCHRATKPDPEQGPGRS